MASPLTTLRKYQFAFFVFFGVVLMIVFVIDDPLNRWLSSRSGPSRATNRTVATWRGGSIRESDIASEREVRNVVRQFLGAVSEETSKRKGQPRVRELMLSSNDEEIVYTHVLASRAEQMGMTANDETALQYLEKLSADLIPRVELGAIFQSSVGSRIPEQLALNVIKTELLAQNYIAMTYPDLSGGQLPAQAWEYFQRLHRRVQAEILPVKVADFKAKVQKQPT
ncbi:MAG: hypothetical protein AB7F89_16210, partial [Pirellulaceae bacterium]